MNKLTDNATRSVRFKDPRQAKGLTAKEIDTLTRANSLKDAVSYLQDNFERWDSLDGADLNSSDSIIAIQRRRLPKLGHQDLDEGASREILTPEIDFATLNKDSKSLNAVAEGSHYAYRESPETMTYALKRNGKTMVVQEDKQTGEMTVQSGTNFKPFLSPEANSIGPNGPETLPELSLLRKTDSILANFERVSNELKNLDGTNKDASPATGVVAGRLERSTPARYNRATYKGAPLCPDPSPSEFLPTRYDEYGNLEYNPKTGEVASLDFEPHYAGSYRLKFRKDSEGNLIYRREQLQMLGNNKEKLTLHPDGSRSYNSLSGYEVYRKIDDAKGKARLEAEPSPKEIRQADRKKRGARPFVPTLDEAGMFSVGSIAGLSLGPAAGLFHSLGGSGDDFPWEKGDALWKKICGIGAPLFAAAGVATAAAMGPAGVGLASLVGFGGPALLTGLSAAKVRTARRLNRVRDEIVSQRMENWEPPVYEP